MSEPGQPAPVTDAPHTAAETKLKPGAIGLPGLPMKGAST